MTILVVTISAILLIGLPIRATGAIKTWDLRDIRIKVFIACAFAIIGIAEFVWGLLMFQIDDAPTSTDRSKFMVQAFGVIAMIGGVVFASGSVQVLTWKVPDGRGQNLGFCVNCGSDQGYQFDRMDWGICRECNFNNTPKSPNVRVLYCNNCGFKRLGDGGRCSACGNQIRLLRRDWIDN